MAMEDKFFSASCERERGREMREMECRAREEREKNGGRNALAM